MPHHVQESSRAQWYRKYKVCNDISNLNISFERTKSGLVWVYVALHFSTCLICLAEPEVQSVRIAKY